MALSYPLINGVRYDFSSIEHSFNGQTRDWTAGIKEISFSDELEPGEVYGTYAQSVGTTRGQYKAEGSLTMYTAEAQELIDLLGGDSGLGWMETLFTWLLNYSETGQALITRDLQGCRIKKCEESGSAGSDPTETKFDLRIGMIVRNGKYPVSKVKK